MAQYSDSRCFVFNTLNTEHIDSLNGFREILFNTTKVKTDRPLGFLIIQSLNVSDIHDTHNLFLFGRSGKG